MPRPETKSDLWAGGGLGRQVRWGICFPRTGGSGGLLDRLSSVTTTDCHQFREHLGDWQGVAVSVLETDAAGEGLEKIVQDVLRLRRPAWYVSAGFAVALQPELKRKTLLFGTEVVDVYRKGWPLEDAAGALRGGIPDIVRGKQLGADEFPRGQEKFDWRGRFESTRPLSVVLQSHTIARACSQGQTPMLALHGVAEELEDDDPVTRRWPSYATSAGKFGAALGALFAGRQHFVTLWNRHEIELQISDRLAATIGSLIEADKRRHPARR